jgi:oxygen-dependent protoporphyrinogen oxidase
MLGLIHDVGLGDDVVPIPNSHPAAQNRYLLDTDTAALKRVGLGWNTPAPVKALIRGALLEPFRARGGAAAADVTDESVGSFFARRFGPDAAGVASAFVHGIYAADPDKLSLRSAFGILHAAEEKYGSVVLGMLLGARSKEDKAAEARAWAQLGPLGDERKGWSMYGLRGGIEGLTQALEVGAARHGAVVRTHETVTRLDPQEHGVKVGFTQSPPLLV